MPLFENYHDIYGNRSLDKENLPVGSVKTNKIFVDKVFLVLIANFRVSKNFLVWTPLEGGVVVRALAVRPSTFQSFFEDFRKILGKWLSRRHRDVLIPGLAKTVPIKLVDIYLADHNTVYTPSHTIKQPQYNEIPSKTRHNERIQKSRFLYAQIYKTPTK